MKILLVDDELIIRKGMRTFIPWEKLDCTLAGEASDGMEALKIMKDIHADIVITDIRMPGMDGLELAGNLQKEFPDTKIILLTGFDDFEYARKALRYNVVEYLLKPVGEEELTRVLQKTVADIKTAEQNNHITEENRVSLQQDLTRKLLYRGDEIPLLIPRLKKLGMEIDNRSGYQSVIIFPVSENFRNPIPDSSFTIPFNKDEINCLLFLVIQKENRSAGAAIHELLWAVEQSNLSAAVGLKITGYSRIHESRESAEEAFSYRHFLTGPGIIHSADLPRIRKKFLDTLPPPLSPEELKKMVIHEFRSLKPEVENIGARLLSYCLNENLNLNDYLRFCRILFQQAQAEIREKGFPVSSRADPVPEIQPLDSWQDILQKINRLFSELGQSEEQQLKKGFSLVTVQAVRYIENHFKDDISLKDISDITSVSESHISRIFKRDTGINLIPWINRFRVNYSKDLLETTDLKLYDIADLSGFSNYKYYFLQFKKFVGITPGEYRENHLSG